MAKRSVKLNKLEEKISIINKNIKDIYNEFGYGYFDVVVTNPPYKKKETGKVNENKRKLISRHEITANLEDFIEVSSKILKDKGEFYMIHRAERIVDVMYYLRRYKLEPKILRFVHSKTENT